MASRLQLLHGIGYILSNATWSTLPKGHFQASCEDLGLELTSLGGPAQLIQVFWTAFKHSRYSLASTYFDHSGLVKTRTLIYHREHRVS